MELRDCTKHKGYVIVASGFEESGPHYEMRGIFLGFTKFLSESYGVFQGQGSYLMLVRPDDIIEIEEEQRRYIW